MSSQRMWAIRAGRICRTLEGDRTVSSVVINLVLETEAGPPSTAHRWRASPRDYHTSPLVGRYSLGFHRSLWPVLASLDTTGRLVGRKYWARLSLGIIRPSVELLWSFEASGSLRATRIGAARPSPRRQPRTITTHRIYGSTVDEEGPFMAAEKKEPGSWSWCLAFSPGGLK